MLYSILRSVEFDAWLSGLPDEKGKARVAARIVSAEFGNFGECKPVGGGVSEMRIDHGPGYRVYFVRRGKLIYLLLLGGDKSNQKRDIARAKAMSLTSERAGH